MNQLFLFSIFFIFFIFTNENIVYKDVSSECVQIEDVRDDSSYTFDFSKYVINTEYCSRHNAQLNGKKCCHVILVDDKITKDFCGFIDKNEYDNITQAIERINSSASLNLIEIKIDCVSKKLEFMITTLITFLIYLI